MTEHNSNPFVLPGMGQGSADMAGNPLLASMEMMRKAWAGLTGPGGLAQAIPLATPMNLEDLDRRIAELRTVEGWLRMNLTMLSSTIQGMEVQRSTIATLRSFVDSVGAQAADPSLWTGASPLEVALGLKRPGQERAQASPSDAPPPDRKAEAPPEPAAAADGGAAGGSAAGSSPGGTLPPGADPLASAQAIGNAAQSASEAWWGLLQQQFNQIAAATAATMPQGGPGMPAGATHESGDAAPAAQGAAAKPAAPAARAAAGTGSKTAAKTASKSAAKPRKPASRKIDPDMDA
jgi:hypothetical protein